MSMDIMPVGDINMAVEWETSRIMREADGDRARAHYLVLAELVKQELISEHELQELGQIVELGSKVDREEATAEHAYIEARRIHYELLRSRTASPVALMISSTAAASYISIDESGKEPTVVFSKATATWDQIGTGIGAGIGGIVGGRAQYLVAPSGLGLAKQSTSAQRRSPSGGQRGPHDQSPRSRICSKLLRRL
jgi:F0F1-type ATP synthase membrane subunit c/vacuolar-type H+-ATPase subunit K